MMNIRKHFANSKKRNLRDNFKDATYSKISPREAYLIATTIILIFLKNVWTLQHLELLCLIT